MSQGLATSRHKSWSQCLRDYNIADVACDKDRNQCLRKRDLVAVHVPGIVGGGEHDYIQHRNQCQREELLVGEYLVAVLCNDDEHNHIQCDDQCQRNGGHHIQHCDHCLRKWGCWNQSMGTGTGHLLPYIAPQGLYLAIHGRTFAMYGSISEWIVEKGLVVPYVDGPDYFDFGHRYYHQCLSGKHCFLFECFAAFRLGHCVWKEIQ